MRAGKKTVMCGVLCAGLSSFACAAPAWTNPVEAAYSEIWAGFYGPGKAKALLTASPALLPDGKPAFVVDAKTDAVSLPIRLEVSTAAFEAWRQDAHRRLSALGTAQCRPVALGDADARIIGGRAFRFDDEGETCVRKWEKSPAAKKAAIAIRAEALTAKGRKLGQWDAPIRLFSRSCNDEFPFPLHNLNRLLDIPPSTWNWVGDGVEPGADAETAVFAMPLPGLSPGRAKAIETVRCTVMDEDDFMPEIVESAPPAVLKLDEDMLAVPGRDFLISRYEVTQELWESVMKATAAANPSKFKGPNLPVESVSWDECNQFLIRLNALPAVRLRGHVYRLPTEEEWEYACRAGAEGAFCKMTNGTEVTEATLGSVAWIDDNSEKTTHPVGLKEPNAFGLYDMHGNVWEWTSTTEESDRVTKGGGWNGNAGRCESANRNRFFPAHRFPMLGLRLVRETEDPR